MGKRVHKKKGGRAKERETAREKEREMEVGGENVRIKRDHKDRVK